jgi:hypothetical protein
MPGGYNPMMGSGGYAPQQHYGGYRWDGSTVLKGNEYLLIFGGKRGWHC